MYIGQTPLRTDGWNRHFAIASVVGEAIPSSLMPDDSTPATPAQPDLPVLRPASLAALRALDPRGGDDFLKRVLSTYLTSLDRHVHVADAARAAGQLKQVRTEAHTLKSSSESIGAIEFSRHCARLEQRLRERGEGPSATAGQAPAEPELTAELNLFFEHAKRVRLAVVGVLAELGLAES